MKSFTDQKALMDHLSPPVFAHLKSIQQESNLPDTEQSFSRITEAWLLKRALFDRMIEHGNFKKARVFQKNTKSGCIAMTLSGSIIAIGPIVDGKREVIYTSLGMRTSVPEVFIEKNGVLAEDMVVDSSLALVKSKLKSTSHIVAIGIAEESEDVNDQINNIEEIKKFLEDNFIKVNENTFKANYFDDELINKNDLFNTWVILSWFELGGLARHIFHARAKILWLELFSSLYKALSNNKSLKDKRDELFTTFTNERFSRYIDDYKWFESEKKDFDIGLMKALEEIPGYANYHSFVNDYINELEKGT